MLMPHPPVIVDEDGDFYGYLTVNRYKTNRANFDLAEMICKFWETIIEDVSEAYDTIFQ